MCHQGSKCESHHCPLPYHWQYRQSLEGWKSFTKEDNCRIEELFCDPKNDVVSAADIDVAFKSYSGERWVGETSVVSLRALLLFNLGRPYQGDTLLPYPSLSRGEKKKLQQKPLGPGCCFLVVVVNIMGSLGSGSSAYFSE